MIDSARPSRPPPLGDDGRQTQCRSRVDWARFQRVQAEDARGRGRHHRRWRVDAIVNAGQSPEPARRWRDAVPSIGPPGQAFDAAACHGRSAVARWATRASTPGYRLPARHVDPCGRAGVAGWRAGRTGAAGLRAIGARSTLAARQGWRRCAFPAISTGMLRLSPRARSADRGGGVVETLAREPGLEEVIFCCFGRASAELHERALAAQEAGRRAG